MSSDLIFFASINVLMAWSVYLAWSAGLLTFGASAFMAIGCYAAGLLTVKAGWSMLPACFAGAAIAGLCGAIITYPALRTKGIYFILTTLGIAVSTQVLLENIDSVGGTVGFGGMAGATAWHAVGAVLTVGILLLILSQLPFKRLLDAVRQDEQVAASMGINIVLIKMIAVVASAVLAGFAGGLYGHYLTFVRPDTFGIIIATYSVMYVILGGTSNFLGAALGATLMTLLPEYIVFLQQWRPTVFAIAVILMLWFRPQGLLTFNIRTAWLHPKKVSRWLRPGYLSDISGRYSRMFLKKDKP